MAVQLDVRQPILLGPGDGEAVTDRAERRVAIKAEHNLLDVTETRYAAGEAGPKQHVHRRHTDAFYVLEGALVFRLGPESERVQARAGTIVLAPANVIHSFENEGPGDARFLNIHAPSMGFAESLRARQGANYDPAEFDSFDPPADGGRPVPDAVVRGPGEGDAIAVGPSGLVFKAEVGDGDGTFSLSETTLAPGFPGPVPHLHERLVDTFFVLEGTLTLRLGEREVEAEAGSYAVVPPGNVHTFANRSDRTVRVLNLMAPGGFEQYLKEVAAAAKPGEAPDPAMMAQIASRYDFQPV